MGLASVPCLLRWVPRQNLPFQRSTGAGNSEQRCSGRVERRRRVGKLCQVT